MTGTQAIRRLRAVGFVEQRAGKHMLMVRDGQRVALTLGSKVSHRQEMAVMRILKGRPTTRDTKK